MAFSPQDADPTATAVLTIDLGAFRANYRAIAARAAPAQCAAVIKANAYGTGVERAVSALSREGCSTVFVATFAEAQAVRDFAPDITVYVLDGHFPGSGEAYASAAIRPVLSSLGEVQDWVKFCTGTGKRLPAAIHVDTGMNRLGITRAEAEELAQSDLLSAFKPALLMSHLACADEPDHHMNGAQLAAFEKLRTLFPGIPASLASSGSVLLGPAYRFDMVRPGFSLYGGRVSKAMPALSPVVQLHARIAQVHEAAAGETVGYGAVQTLQRDTRIATISLGYADGIPRSAGAQDGRRGMTGYIEEYAAPVLGRVSMDLITLDITEVPQELAQRGAWVEILGDHVSVDDLAAQAGTIGYEVLTSLSRRAQRVYIGSQGSPV